MLRREYRCLDGSPFPVTFPSEESPSQAWVLDREHVPTAMTTLADAVKRVGGRGAERAYEADGLRPPALLGQPPPLANGYLYVTERWLTDDEQENFADGVARLRQAHGGSAEVWRAHSLPRVKSACDRLAAAPPSAPFAALAELHALAYAHTAVAGVVAKEDLQAMEAMCEPLVGAQAKMVAYELALGSPNDTVAADEALATIAKELSRITPADAPGTRVLRPFLDEYGTQATSWTIDHPTLEERPDLLSCQLELLRRSPERDPTSLGHQARRRRDRLADDLRNRLTSELERAEFDRRLTQLSSFVAVREGRARWQLTATGLLRRAVLRRGELLVDRGVLRRSEDVFHLTPSEYDLGEAANDVVARRRAEHDHWRSVTPPPVLGPAAGPLLHPTRLVGACGSRGRAAGVARVVLDLADADRLRPGDILVTTMTSPPWTPLIAVARAVVTDAGDDLSHVAIAAREYGIPCVVGTGYATVAIPDGATITVDGDAGLVGIEAPFERAGRDR